MSIQRFESEKLASLYLKHRPTYPAQLFTEIINYLKNSSCIVQPGQGEKYGCAVDVACGNGQSTLPLALYFDQVYGTDISEAQIKCAQQEYTDKPGVQFLVAPAENLPFADNTVQLITVATGLHWLEFDKFYSECDRVLIPGGVIACYCITGYNSTCIIPDNEGASRQVTDYLEKFFQDIFDGGFGHERQLLISNEYTHESIQIPYQDRTRMEPGVTRMTNLSTCGVIDYLRTRSGVARMLEVRGEEGKRWLQEVEQSIREILHSHQVEDNLSLEQKVFMIIGRKPGKSSQLKQEVHERN